MKIEMLSSYRHEGQIFEAGDIRNNVPNGFGAFLVKNGFAKDLDGNVETGEKPTQPVRLKPEDLTSRVEG